jgi:hypothetical protein
MGKQLKEKSLALDLFSSPFFYKTSSKNIRTLPEVFFYLINYLNSYIRQNKKITLSKVANS